MLWPDSCRRDASGVLEIGGVSVTDLAARFGTPLYVFDEATIRAQARAVRSAFADAWPRSRVVFAGKALMNLAVLRVLDEEGIGLDVVSGGELAAGVAAGIDPARMTFHGNNKSTAELAEAVAAGVGLVAVDNLHEVGELARVAGEAGRGVDCLLRVNPGIDTHTHDKIRTGHLDSKFGVPVSTGAAAEAVAAIAAAPHLRLRGYHCHIGSQLFDATAYAMAVEVLLGFAARMRDEHGIEPEILSPGGGFGIAYGPDQEAASFDRWARETSETVRAACQRHGLAEPELIVEPGRSLVGRAGVALYSVGSVKAIPGVRTFVAVDGGMADNIRPTLYGATYHVELVSRPADGPVQPVTIAGRYCESGDILVERVDLPELRAGDLIALPAAGAYTLAMASNYNMALRPAAVMVRDGEARLIRRRETYADLLAVEVDLDRAGDRSAAMAGSTTSA